MLRRSFFFACLAALAVVGCRVNTINYFPPHPAQVRILNLLAGSSVDVAINGAPAFSNVAFQTATGYQTYDNQSTTFVVTFSGTTTQVGTFSFPLGGEQPYTLVVYGSSTAPLMTLVSEVASPPVNGNVQLSVFNAAQNAPTVDIYITAPGVNIAGVNPNFSGVSYSGTSFNLAFPPGTYQIQVTNGGTKTVIYDSGGTVYNANIAVSFITYAVGSGTLVNAALLQSKGPYTTLNTIFSRIKAVNAATGTGTVNQLQGNVPINLNVLYPAASPYTNTATGPTTINFEASATPGAIIASVPGSLLPANDYTAVVAGLPGAQQAFLLQDSNIATPAGGDRVRFVNASAGSNPVNASINGTQLASNVAFGTASAYATTAPATVNVTFTDAVTGAVVASQDGVVITANQTGSIYLIGPPGAQGVFVTQDN
jgi:Domain of unknown function (DUF4397)